MVRQLQLDPAEQALAVFRLLAVGQTAVVAEYRQQEARGVVAAAQGQVAAVAARQRVEHARPGTGQQRVFGTEEADRADVGLLQGLPGDALELLGIAARQCRRGQRRQLLGDHPAALQQLPFQLVQLHPDEVAAQAQGHQAGGQQAEQQHAALEAKILEHAAPPVCFRAV
ncbi:hypothetical protein D9M70_304500 [compost metagenome]